MPETTWLSSTVTVKRYREMEKAKDRNALADFIYGRLSERYLAPVTTGAKNGFAMMACACLLIETPESFYSGWKSAQGAGAPEIAFDQFFQRAPRFSDFKCCAKDFYQNVRCGILHQGETKGGWQITRAKGVVLFDPKAKIIHAIKFLKRLDWTLRDYTRILKTSNWRDELWRNFRRKMNGIIKNCESKL